ncbi:prolyl endopeptidase [Niastella vici]|uniref:prolyl oligopeptidase n=1 Tax=Niastella vici TaxID=1703345 RepID=A0A1V9FSY0_9BACT|nr:prolyl oligopeptidase family serine peptidase [Niastella vici]OQP61444.1 prolyl endopeptidase [Niastella vici]
MTPLYPETRKTGDVHIYHGREVADPYNWLEDMDSPETCQWAEEQNRFTRDYLDRIPFREAINRRLETLWNYERYSVPFTAGAYLYFYRNNGHEAQSVLYRQTGGREPEIFFDPNDLSDDGIVSLTAIEFSGDGSLAAFQLSEAGSDWQKVFVIRSSDRQILADVLTKVKFSRMAWRGNQGFYYTCYGEAGAEGASSGTPLNARLYYHRLGTLQKEDELVFEGRDGNRRFINAYLTADESFLVIGTAMSATGNDLYIQNLKEPDSDIVCVVDHLNSRTSIVHNDGSLLYLHTNINAPNFTIVTAEAADPSPGRWRVFLPEAECVLQVSVSGGMLFAHYLENAVSKVLQYRPDGSFVREVAFPKGGTVSGFWSKAIDNKTYYTFSSYTCAPVIFAYDVVTGESSLYKFSQVRFDEKRYESKQVFYTSCDGCRIPMTVIYRKGLVMNGRNPALLYGYGGFGTNMLPEFDVSNIILLEQDGVYAVPNIRGGGEYGRNWHEAGMRMNKQTVFDDFIAAAEYLINNKYTSAAYMAIAGTSNGGLLAGAVMAQRPDICKVVFPACGVMDMLRYHKFPAGVAWTKEYGTADDSKEMFECLLKYSPYHSLKPAAYPAALIMTADHDDRVAPAHSFKFTAQLQECQLGAAPVFVRIEKNAGHGSGRSTEQLIKEQADKWAFFFANIPAGYSLVF